MPDRIWEQGVLFLIIAAIGYASYRGMGWLATHAILPAVQSHVSFLKCVADSITAQTALIKHIEEQLDSLYRMLGKTREDSQYQPPSSQEKANH
jgi:hypothetical protein